MKYPKILKLQIYTYRDVSQILYNLIHVYKLGEPFNCSVYWTKECSEKNVIYLSTLIEKIKKEWKICICDNYTQFEKNPEYMKIRDTRN